MVKFRKKTHRKLNKKSKRSIKGGARYYCYTERELGKINRDAATGSSGSYMAEKAAKAASEATAMTQVQKEAAAAGMPEGVDKERKRKERGANSPLLEDILMGPSSLSPGSPPALRRRMSSLSDSDEQETGGGSKKRKRRKKKKTRKARGIIDDLRTLCTTGRCGSPRPQRPTLRELALTIERNMIDDFNTKSPEETLTAKDRRNIKALANDEAARIVNTSSSASKKKKKKKKKKKRNL